MGEISQAPTHRLPREGKSVFFLGMTPLMDDLIPSGQSYNTVLVYEIFKIYKILKFQLPLLSRHQQLAFTSYVTGVISQ